jgi:Glu-tRNA(Gln) amidotransferase subunit E-like FAD-binding protein
MYASRLNNFKHNNSKLGCLLKNKISLQQDIKKLMWDNIEDEDWDRCKISENWVKLDESTENISKMIEEHKKSTNNILVFLEEVIKKLENMEALSVYRDFIFKFFEEVKAKLGADVWAKVKAAINRKLRSKKVNFKQNEEEYISKLRNFLQEINMTVENIERIMLFKKKSNAKFHQGERLEPEKMREKFEMSFPEDLNDFKDSFRKAFDALDNWDRD